MPDETVTLTPDYTDKSATFGDRLSAAREQTGLSQAEVAKHLGVTLKTLQNWEQDRSAPRSSRLQFLAGMLNVSIMWLMSGRGDAPGPDDSTTTQEREKILTELRNLSKQQAKLAQKMAQFENKLRAAIEHDRISS